MESPQSSRKSSGTSGSPRYHPRIQEILDSYAAGVQADNVVNSRFLAAVCRPPVVLSVPTLGRFAEQIRALVPYRSAAFDKDGGKSQTVRTPLAALHAGGNCDDYAYLCGLLLYYHRPGPRPYFFVQFLPNEQAPRHIRLVLGAGDALFTCDPTPGFVASQLIDRPGRGQPPLRPFPFP